MTRVCPYDMPRVASPVKGYVRPHTRPLGLGPVMFGAQGEFDAGIEACKMKLGTCMANSHHGLWDQRARCDPAYRRCVSGVESHILFKE